MRCFLDMNIILYYVGEGNNEELEEKSKKFLGEKGEDIFLLCYYIKDMDLPKWLDRQKSIFKELIKKVEDDSYVLYSSKDSSKLTSRDKRKIAKLLMAFQKKGMPTGLLKNLKNISYELERRINEFLQDFIDEFVIPINDIDKELVSHLNSFISLGESRLNISDVKTLASGIQEHNNKKLTLITADRKDWTKDFLGEVQYHPSLNKRYPSLPKIQYIQDF